MAEGVELCSCELESHGNLGSVKDAERLVRVVFNPNHIRKKCGGLKPGVFPLSHIAKSGLSLMRLEHLTPEELAQKSKDVADSAEGQGVAGVLVGKASRIRGMVDSDARRLMCVVDDPVINHPKIPDNIAHAISVSSIERSEDDIQELRADLLDLFSGILSVYEAHDYTID